jgi:ABC-type branched-subunit amino acid transport system ATPase component
MASGGVGFQDAVPTRDQIPSEREVLEGLAPQGFVFKPVPVAIKASALPWYRRVSAQFRMLDPRGIAPPGARLPLVVIGLLSTVGSFDLTAFGFLIIFIKADFHISFQYLFTISSLVGLVTVLTSPIGGFVADRVKRVWMLRIGFLIENAATILSSLAPSPGVLTGSRVMAGMGPSISTPASLPLLVDYFPIEKRARVFGFMQMAAAVWGMFSSSIMIFGFIYFGLSWRVLLAGAGLAGTGIALLAFKIHEPIRGEADRLSLGASAEAARREQRPASWTEAWRIISSVATLRRIWLATPFQIATGTALNTFLYFAIRQRFALHAQGGLMSNPKFAQYLPVFFILFPGIIQASIIPFATNLADRLMMHRPGRIMYYAGALQLATGLATLGILVIPNFFAALILLFALGAVSGLIAPARQVLTSVVVPPRVRAQGFQSVTFSQLPGYLLFPFLGTLADRYGPYRASFLLLPVMVIGAAILMSSGTNVERDIRNAVASSMADEESRAARKRGANKMIVTRKIVAEYDGAKVLDGVDFDVEEGEIVALLGTNGAGKSTLMRVICGVHQATGGAVYLDGEDITHKPPHLNARDGIVFLPGGRAIFPTLTVAENLAAAAWLNRDDQDYVRQRTQEILDLFPILAERSAENAGDLSGGEQQMLALGQAFLMRPRLLMIDELSLGLAPSIVEKILDVVRGIQAQGTTIILVEQSVNVAVTIAQRAVFMEQGTIRFDGSTEALLRREDLVRAVFLGGASGAFVGLGLPAATGYGQLPERMLDVADVQLAFGGVRALQGVSLEVFAGEVVGIIGPNGAGKTTLFDVISGVVRPDAGQLRIKDTDLDGLALDARARLGLARSFQDTRLFSSLTVRETIAVALERQLQTRSAALAALWAPKVRRSERRVTRRVDYLIDLLGLGEHSEKFISELSTGSRRMVDIACMMAAEPAILLLDEPSSGIAQGEIEVLAPLIQRLAREAGCGVLVIEHDIPLISEMSDRLIAMELGQVIAHGSPEEVLTDRRVLTSYLCASASVIQRSGDLLGSALSAIGLSADDLSSSDLVTEHSIGQPAQEQAEPALPVTS